MPSVGAKDHLGVAAVVDQDAVEALVVLGADEALRIRVTVRAARRDLHHIDVFAQHDGVEGGRELRVPVPSQVREPVGVFAELATSAHVPAG